MEDWIFALDDFIEILTSQRLETRSLRQLAVLDSEIDDVKQLRAFIAGFIKGKESAKDA